MTRQENILTLNEHLEHWKRLLSEKICDQDEGEKTIDALQNAINVLEQEPCADMVSRDAMWDVLQRLHGTEGELVDELMSLPPVLPMPKMGQWTHDGSHWENRWICSECGYKLFFPQTRFCPNCGAKMPEIPTGAEGSE